MASATAPDAPERGMGKKALIAGSVFLALILSGAASFIAMGDGGDCSGASVSSCGSIIIDNTPNPGLPALATNMSTNIGGKAFGTNNSFKIDGIQVMQRKGDTESDITILMDEVGVYNPASTSYNNYGKGSQLKYFANGSQLFDLDRFRTAADWLRANISATTSHPAGSYGTIGWTEFLQNVAASRTMYGMVRIKVPLKLTGTTGRNALDYNNDQSHTALYGFCGSSTAGLCSSAPGSSTKIKPNETVNGVSIPNGAQIKVRGALMFDFVDNATGEPVGLINLPWDPRDIYFKVEIPINVNAANDSNGDGVMDNINYISSITSGTLCATPPCSVTVTQSINYNQVPQEAKDAFKYQYGVDLTSTIFDGLSEPNQYHLLMPSGYPYGWHDAFQELGVTSAQWKSLGFDAPTAGAVDGVLSVDEIRSDLFEDIPVYIYTGGLVDMHDNVNISGLVYVPQALELEQKSGSVRQFIMGAVIVRDAFYLEAKTGGVTLISSDPTSFSNIRVKTDTSDSGFVLASVPGGTTASSEPIVGNPAWGTTLPGYPPGTGDGGGTPGPMRWVEIHPR